MVLAGKGDAFVGGEHPPVQGLHFVEHVALHLPVHLELEYAVGEGHGHARLQPLENLGSVQADEHGGVGLVPHLRQSQGDGVALVEGDRGALHLADADLGAAQVGHHREGHAQFVLHLPDGFYRRLEVGRVGVGEVEAQNTHAVAGHVFDDGVVH